MNDGFLSGESLITVFEKTVRDFPDKVALLFLGEQYRYHEIKTMVYRFATALHELGVCKGDRVLLCIPNCPQWLIVYYAVQKIGAVVVPVSPMARANELLYQSTDSGAETIICQDTNFGYVWKVFQETPLQRVIVTNLADMLPRWKRLTGWLFHRIPAGNMIKGPQVYFFRELLRSYPPNPPEVELNFTDQLSCILYTAGTTGLPKGVPGTHAEMLAYVRAVHHMIDGFISKGHEVFVLMNPLNQLMSEIMLISLGLTLGNTTILMPLLDVDALLETIQKYKATLLFGTPPLYRMILGNDRLQFYDLSSIRYPWSSEDLLFEYTFHRFLTRTGKRIYQVYGSTETGPLSLSPLERDPAARCVGRPFASCQMLIVHPGSLEPVSPGHTGELLVATPPSKGYWQKPEDTAQSFIELDSKRWFKTSDYVWADEQGELHFVDRKDDLIHDQRGNISASQIESVLLEHEAVSEACAIGLPDAKAGEERIKAIVVNTRGVDSDELIGWCSQRLDPRQVPQYIEFRDMLPKSHVGKLLRREVRAEEFKHHAEELIGPA